MIRRLHVDFMQQGCAQISRTVRGTLPTTPDDEHRSRMRRNVSNAFDQVATRTQITDTFSVTGLADDLMDRLKS